MASADLLKVAPERLSQVYLNPRRIWAIIRTTPKQMGAGRKLHPHPANLISGTGILANICVGVAYLSL